jgi:hypothetical protein
MCECESKIVGALISKTDASALAPFEHTHTVTFTHTVIHTVTHTITHTVTLNCATAYAALH